MIQATRGRSSLRNIIEVGDSIMVMMHLDTDCVDLVLTDPPYDMNEVDQEIFQREALRISKHGMIAFCSPENPLIKDPDQRMFWIKSISTKNTSRRYSRFVELILIKGTDIWNTGRHWSQYTNVATDLVQKLSDHPYEKPLSLVERLLLNHSSPGMLIFDPFAGSGTLGVVCQRNDRDYFLIETDQDMVAFMTKRLL